MIYHTFPWTKERRNLLLIAKIRCTHGNYVSATIALVLHNFLIPGQISSSISKCESSI